MDVSYDYWQGESLDIVLQSIAEFRKQVLIHTESIQNHSLSDEINYLKHYFDSESTVIVANDCGLIVGYIAIVNELDAHPLLNDYTYYGPDLVVTEGPVVNKDYRGQGIAKSLITEALNVCQNRDVELLIFEPNQICSGSDKAVIKSLADQINCFNISQGEAYLFKKEIESSY